MEGKRMWMILMQPETNRDRPSRDHDAQRKEHKDRW